MSIPDTPFSAQSSHPSKPADALLTRREAAQFINDELGRPMAFSTLTKVCAQGEGPPVASWWSKRALYRREDLKTWAESRGRAPGRFTAPTNDARKRDTGSDPVTTAAAAPTQPPSRQRGRPPKVRPAGGTASDNTVTAARAAQKASMEVATG